MTRFIQFLAEMSMFTLLPGCIHAKDTDNTPVPSFELSRLFGCWYEIARFNHSFERGLVGVTADYLLRGDGKIDVINSGYKGEQFKVAKGIARQPWPDTDPARLRVSFFLFFYSDYRILKVDKDYEIMLVGGSDDDYLWILSRDRKPSQELLDMVMADAIRRGYDTSKLIWN